MHVDELGLSPRTTKGLKSYDIYTLLQLSRFGERQLLRIDNFGKKCLKEVKDMLVDYGIELKKNARTNIKAEDVKSKEQLNRMDKIELFDEALAMHSRLKMLEARLSQATQEKQSALDRLAAAGRHQEYMNNQAWEHKHALIARDRVIAKYVMDNNIL